MGTAVGRRAIVALSALLALASCDAGAPTRQPLPGTIESQRVSPPPNTSTRPATPPTPPEEIP